MYSPIFCYSIHFASKTNKNAKYKKEKKRKKKEKKKKIDVYVKKYTKNPGLWSESKIGILFIK